MRQPPPAAGRRSVLTAALTAALSLTPMSPSPAVAAFGDMLTALPQANRDWQRVGFLEEKLRPKVRALPRRRMDIDFAILLMRTSYQVADELDFMPMDAFREQYPPSAPTAIVSRLGSHAIMPPTHV
jgi:hypothetical protein